MKELLRTNDMAQLSWFQALLDCEGIQAVVFDTHTSILEGSANAIPRRLMVVDEDFEDGDVLTISGLKLTGKGGIGGYVLLVNDVGDVDAEVEDVVRIGKPELTSSGADQAFVVNDTSTAGPVFTRLRVRGRVRCDGDAARMAALGSGM